MEQWRLISLRTGPTCALVSVPVCVLRAHVVLSVPAVLPVITAHHVFGRTRALVYFISLSVSIFISAKYHIIINLIPTERF